ncbi:PEP-utilizing enzyme, partial [Bacillus sp. JJ1474]|uniref:PEP-utilizing enzyme n=1 Tax=Bacillus sp. JJ1474 TaxID=3122955 RepID=UPI003000CEC3
EQYIKIQSLIEEFQFDFNVDELIEFIRTSISAREEAKFEFTKNLSDVLSLINDYGSNLEICREDLAFIRVESILGLANKSELINVKNELQRQVTIGKEQYGITEFTKLPPIITTEKDIVAFIINEDQPNYVTNKSITGEIIVLNGDFQNTNLDNKIVVIECADPGYDWIFTHSIVGLITKYGGANSHMAIRCTEFNIPAAIGCGEVIYTKVVSSKLAELNCGVGYVKVQ